MLLEQRIQNYVERYHLKSGLTEWPTVRKVARGLKVSMKLVFNTVEGDYRCDTQGWNIEEINHADLEVYTDTNAIEAAWAKLWGDKWLK